MSDLNTCNEHAGPQMCRITYNVNKNIKDMLGWMLHLPLIAVYIDSLVIISIDRSETNKKRALEI